MKKSYLLLLLLGLSSVLRAQQYETAPRDNRIQNFGNVTLEMSLKPFKQNTPEYIREVCRTMFRQWTPLLSHADTVSILLWTSDGSEILDYTGDPNQPLEWGMYAGNPNAPHAVNSGPKELNLHQRAYTYIADPPAFTYGDLRFIIATLKEVGRRETGKVIRVGETFDPGPEFAKSPFKYERHPEICMANTLGAKSFVCCYATLNADERSYASYPDGIPQGTPLGTFLGKQSHRFLADMGFDYFWLSNGFGFGMETWNTVGAIFDGNCFRGERMPEIQQKILDFWTTFRKECPDVPIETRGTNLSAGIDLARDGVDLRSIYRGGFNLLPPPNSPWAALDGDFGLELTGYMSRISEIPDCRYLFRYYTHDPWWANTPWLDRYGREAHDIYLPMSVSRIDTAGRIVLPSNLNLLTVDDTYGNMPDQVPEEVIPHLLQARRTAPDQAGPVVWVYPFDEYHDWAFEHPERLAEVFYGDWFIRQALNEGFPMNTVVSTTTFTALMQRRNPVLDASVLVTIVPEAGSDLETALIDFVERGGCLIVYGPVGHGSDRFLDFLNIRKVEPLDGVFSLKLTTAFDQVDGGSMQLRHDGTFSGGGLETRIRTSRSDTRILARAVRNGQNRDVVVFRRNPEWYGGGVCYVRGTNSARYTGGMLLSPDLPSDYFRGGSLMRQALAAFGYEIRFEKVDPDLRTPVNVISRNRNGYIFSGYVPNQTVEQQFLFPQGAPIFTGQEALLKDGRATYRLPRAWSEECRVFVQQNDGIVSCWEIPPVEFGVRRKIGVNGLKNAVLRVYPDGDLSNYSVMPGKDHYPSRVGMLESVRKEDSKGYYYEYKDISGSYVITW